MAQQIDRRKKLSTHLWNQGTCENELTKPKTQTESIKLKAR